MRKTSICLILLVIISVGLVMPTVLANDNQIVITYGETTYHNTNYKNIVDNYFKGQINTFNDANVKIITANDVNKISTSISKETYNSNQIFSSALVDLSSNDDIEVDVDGSKITTITPSMYQSALESSGITKGHVIVTSPVTATGESALAGIMSCYENATDTVIPEEVKQAANNEIYTESEIVNNSNINPDDLANLVDDVKDQVESENITNHQDIVNIINNITVNNNLNLSSSDVNDLADSIQQTQSVQDSANDYKNQISNALNGSNGESFFDQILHFFGL